MLISFNLHALLEVSLDGTKPYTEIQSAVNSAEAGDTVLVYPGTYFENIDLSNTQNLSLISLEAITNDTTYVSATIINGSHNQTSVIICNGNNTNFLVRGITITGGSGWQGNVFSLGGGVLVVFGNMTLMNSIVKYNSADRGGGIAILPTTGIALSGTTLRNNLAYDNGGGLGIASSYYEQPSIIFDQENRSSIYDNYASLGSDIHWYNHNGGNCEVYLKKFTNSDYEFYYASYFDPNGGYLDFGYNPYYVFDVEEGVHEQVDADLYVSMDGNDNNNGLTPEQALRSTYRAFQIIKSNPDNQRTVHLPAGNYSNCANGHENLPITVKTNTTLQGASAEETIIDGENMKVVQMVGIINASMTGENITIKNMSLPNRTGCTIRSSAVMNLKIENILINNCTNIGTWDRNLHLGSVAYSSVEMKNVLIQNSVSDLFEAAGRVEGIDVTLDNVVVKNNTNTNTIGGGIVGILEVYANNLLNVNKCQFVNNNSAIQTSGGALIRFYGMSDSLVTIIDNSLFANNSNGDTTSNFYLSSDRSITVNNCTLSYNSGGASSTMVLGSHGEINVYNTIFANNSQSYAIRYGNTSLNVDNSLFSNSINNISFTYGNYPSYLGDNNLYERDPLFVGGDPAIYSYYQLSGDEVNGYSPAINAGTEDFSFMPDWYEISQLDLWGNPRIFGDRVDMGCYEYQGYTGNHDSEIALNNLTATNYPNPFNPETTIEFNNPVQGQVSVNIYNLKGQLVKSLLKDNLNQGVHKVIWRGNDSNDKQVSSGVYFYKISSGNNKSVTKKIILMK
ncbi:T9SS type A sorting domain-containing protein [bacterium]|nr:T9SS type A sorting domain-containing protein [bacterium]